MSDDKYLVTLMQFLPFYSYKLALLLEYFGNAKKIWHADSKKLSAVGISSKVIGQFDKFRNNIEPQKYLNRLEVSGINWVTINDKNYPENMRGLKDFPLVLFYKGDLIRRDSESISIVGARKSTSYGREVSYQIAGDLAQIGVTVISGMARGIDSQAHLGALDAGGRTIAVLTDLVKIYPPENITLARKIMHNGCLMSEFPPGVAITQASFVWRNRIVSGLAKGVVVVEGEKKSGTLITASFAADQGKPVFAIPGPINSPNSFAPNFLIQNGAKLTTGIGDISDEVKFNSISRKAGHDMENNISSDEGIIIKYISRESVHIDELARISGITVKELSAKLTIMEMKGLVKNLGSGIYKKK